MIGRESWFVRASEALRNATPEERQKILENAGATPVQISRALNYFKDISVREIGRQENVAHTTAEQSIIRALRRVESNLRSQS